MDVGFINRNGKQGRTLLKDLLIRQHHWKVRDCTLSKERHNKVSCKNSSNTYGSNTKDYKTL